MTSLVVEVGGTLVAGEVEAVVVASLVVEAGGTIELTRQPFVKIGFYQVFIFLDTRRWLSRSPTAGFCVHPLLP